jgi:hypothetical protein
MFKELFESSLSRLWRHNDLHDCAALTAFRKYNNCGYDEDGNPCPGEETPEELTRSENKKRNAALASDLKSRGYGITKIMGTYPEGGNTVNEVSYFVVDLEKRGSLEKDVRMLGEKYNQDSVLFVPKGAVQNKTKAYLIGTNRCCNNWLGYGKKELFNKGKMGYSSPIYTSKINGRPFIFENIKTTDIIFGSSTNAIMAEKWAKEYE